MEIIAAVDLFMGKVVRLRRGDIATAKVYDRDPLEAARRWQEQGADALHLVDLDAALGLGSNVSILQRIVAAVTIPVQIGGGIRSERAARQWLERGVARVVLGTLAMRDPESIGRLVAAFGAERIVVALDFSRAEVLTEGWTRPTAMRVEEAMARFREMGVRRFLVTAVERDGLLAGPEIEIYARLSAEPDVAILASGGIHTLDDVRALKRAGVAGMVIGKALYEERLTLEQIRHALAEEVC